MYDIVIKNGIIIDGTGKPMFNADIGVKSGRIKKVGDLSGEAAEKIINAAELYVAPGFVDVTNHSDTYWRIFLNPSLESLVYQGITTIVGGNCGSSLAPLVSHDMIKSIRKWADVSNINLDWLSMKDFLAKVEKNKLSVNFATLVGHGTLRRGLIQDETRNLSLREIHVMKNILKDAIKEGALGFSTGLVYTHAKQASKGEIVELAKVVKKYKGVYATHIRGESHDLIESLEEAIDIAKSTGVRLQISHIKAMGEKNWHLVDEALNLIETAKSGGVDVDFDVYPYTSTGSVLYIFLPDWVTEGGREMMIRRLKDFETRKEVIEEMKKNDFDYSKVIISISSLSKKLNRRRIVDIAKSQGKSVEEAVIDILIASEGRVVTIMGVLSEKNVIKIIQHPFSIISSNGAGYNLKHKNSGELVHPRNFGSFPRVLGKYVKRERILSWEEAIHKMSGKPAAKFGIKKRGIIKEGNFADIVVFDPNEIKDLATIDNPYRYSRGINWVIVNGDIILEDGEYNGKRAGKVIRR